jgi:hypothetical protein
LRLVVIRDLRLIGMRRITMSGYPLSALVSISCTVSQGIEERQRRTQQTTQR